MHRRRQGGTSPKAHVTADPDRSDRVDLATQDGRYARVLGDGGDGAVSIDDAGGLVLRVVDPVLGPQDQACSVVEQERMGDTPCGKNPVGECDVAWS